MKIKNSNIKYRNSKQYQNSNYQNSKFGTFRFLSFGFVSDFGFRISSLFFFLLFAYLLICLFPAKAGAAGLSLGVYPPIIQIQTQAPASIKTPITLENAGDETVELAPVFKPFTASEDEDGKVSYLPKDKIQGADPLIFQRMQIFDNDRVVNKVVLAPGAQKNLTLHIGLPKDEPPSDYYFSVTFLSIADSNDNEMNKAQALGGIGPVVLLSIGPKGKTQGAIEEFSAPGFLEKGPVPFTVRIKNTSRHFITPNGTILIKNVFGQLVGKVDLLPVNILSNSVRAIPNSKLDAKRYTLDATKALWNESFLLGPYTATLTIALSEQGPLYTRTIYFFAFPAQGLVGILIAIIFVILIRNRVKKQLD